MYRVLVFLVLCNVTLLCSSYSHGENVPSVQVTKLSPAGFKACIPDSEDIQKFSFYGSFNKVVTQLSKSPYRKDVMSPTNGFWCYINTQRDVFNGDVLNYIYEVTTSRSNHLSHQMSFTFTGLNAIETTTAKIETTTPQVKSNEEMTNQITASNLYQPFNYIIKLFGNITIQIHKQDIVNNLNDIFGVERSMKNCTQLLDVSKNTIRSIIQYNAETETKYQDAKEELTSAKKRENNYKLMLQETFKIIELTHRNRTNVLRLETNFMMTDGYVEHVIPNELRIRDEEYNIIRTNRISRNVTEFEVGQYGQKLNIYLTSRVKLRGSKVKFYDVDFE